MFRYREYVHLFETGAKSGCGANAAGGGGFQPGNTCGKGDGAERTSDGEYDGGWTFAPKTSGPDEFIAARNRSRRIGFLSPLSPEDIVNHKLFVSADGTVGYAMSPDGDIQNVFNNGGPRGAGREAVIHAAKNGGKTLDCYDGHMPDYYSQFGFVETGRMKFNDEFAPSGWNYEVNGRPDVVFMALKGEFDEQRARQRLQSPEPHERSGKYYESSEWDKAKSDSRRQ